MGDVAKLFLDVLDNFLLGRGGEALSGVVNKELLEPLSEDTSGDFHLLDSVGNGETFENWDGMVNIITRVDDETSGSVSYTHLTLLTIYSV